MCHVLSVVHPARKNGEVTNRTRNLILFSSPILLPSKFGLTRSRKCNYYENCKSWRSKFAPKLFYLGANVLEPVANCTFAAVNFVPWLQKAKTKPFLYFPGNDVPNLVLNRNDHFGEFPEKSHVSLSKRTARRHVCWCGTNFNRLRKFVSVFKTSLP